MRSLKFTMLVGAACVAGSIAMAQDADRAVPDYVGSETCADCHQDAFDAWTQSHHAHAWMEPSPDTVLADFDNTRFELDGMVTRFSTDGRIYRILVTEKDGGTREYTVHSVAGIEPLQQYIVETQNGRLQSFDVVWDVEQESWYHLYPDQDLPPSDALHWTGPYKNWNARCAECHATGFTKNYDVPSRTYASTQAEIGVGCEACHGPGQAHVNWATAKSPAPDTWPGLSEIGFAMSLSDPDPEVEIQQCATCHARREALEDGNPLPGKAFDDAYRLALLRPGQYHADGQILDEVYVYGSFLQSRMYAQGVRCSNCHEVHSGNLVADGNAVCTQCHNPAGNADFPSLRLKEYDAPSHHFHEAGTAAAECKSCHMIERVYMGIDGRRDHSFRVPRPDLAEITGAPDACTDCHSDETPAWAADAISEWYPDSTHRSAHYGEVLAGARLDRVSQADSLLDLALDASMPPIVRASALDVLSSVATPAHATAAEPLLSDPSALVRAQAVGLQRAAEPSDRVPRILSLLSDPARSVRMAAAREMLGSPVVRMPSDWQSSMDSAMTEWQQSLWQKADFPETLMAIAGTALVMRRPEDALQAFAEATYLDPQLIDAWVMQVRINIALERSDEARAVLTEAMRLNPQAAVLADLARSLQ